MKHSEENDQNINWDLLKFKINYHKKHSSQWKMSSKNVKKMLREMLTNPAKLKKKCSLNALKQI